MDVHADLSAPCDPAALFTWVDDLTRYRAWTSLVHQVRAVAPEADGSPAWEIELRARVGPMARSKRLRMVRRAHDPPRTAVFERRELDVRRHSPWVLSVAVTSSSPGESALAVDLHYGGTLWTGGLLERALTEQIEEGSARLRDLVSERRR